MADYIKKIRTSNGDKQIDYEALANLPTIPLVDMSLTNEGAAADAKATGDAINLVNTRVEEKVENPLTGVVGQILEIETVDESGKPKTYKAVNKPSGGGEVTDEQISNAVDNYMTAHPFTETDPTVPDWAKHPEKPRYTAEEVGADASGTAQSKVSEHNVSDTAHNDIRLLIDGLTTRLNALADSDDTTFDQMSEVVAYIKSNKSLIDAITTSKVNVSDIIDNLTTNASNKPLSAAQGVALKTMIDGITIPTTLPNPNALTFTGAVTGSYDGSSPIEVNIPEGGGTDITVDTTLSVAGQAADAKATGDAISSLSEEIANKTGTGLSTEAIDKLEEVGNYLAYTTADGGSKWTELISILRNGSSGGGSGETVTLQSISATYTGGDIPVGTSVNSLTGLTVTATYSDGSTTEVTDYTLSGTIAEGNNTITVSYGGKTTTFTVAGVAESGGEETGVSNETTWTDGVPYTFDWVENEYVTGQNTSGGFKAYNGWYRSPYLYCDGASTLDIHNPFATSSNYNAFYDADKNYISSFSANMDSKTDSKNTITVPENAVYFAVSYDASKTSATGLPYAITPNA